MIALLTRLQKTNGRFSRYVIKIVYFLNFYKIVYILYYKINIKFLTSNFLPLSSRLFYTLLKCLTEHYCNFKGGSINNLFNVSYKRGTVIKLYKLLLGCMNTFCLQNKINLIFCGK